MPVWIIVVASCASLVGLLLWRRSIRIRNELLSRVAQLEERSAAAEAEARRCGDNVGIVQRLLLEKGVADEEDFEAAKRADDLDAIAHQRGVH